MVQNQHTDDEIAVDAVPIDLSDTHSGNVVSEGMYGTVEQWIDDLVVGRDDSDEIIPVRILAPPNGHLTRLWLSKRCRLNYGEDLRRTPVSECCSDAVSLSPSSSTASAILDIFSTLFIYL